MSEKPIDICYDRLQNTINEQLDAIQTLQSERDRLREALLRALELTVYKIWDCVLVGNQCEHVRKIFEDMRNPQPGDLVIESTSIIRGLLNGGEARGISGIGFLNRIAMEPVYTPEVWKEQGGDDNEPIPTEKVYYVQLFDGREFRWVNADFLKIPVPQAQKLLAFLPPKPE